MRRATAVIGLVVVTACGSTDEPASSGPTPTTERPPAVTVASAVVDGQLLVDYSSLDKWERAMWADLTTAGTGEPVGIFVTPVAGATKTVHLASDAEEEIVIPMGELTEPTDTFDLADVPPGAYELCSELIGRPTMLVCTTFELP